MRKQMSSTVINLIITDTTLNALKCACSFPKANSTRFKSPSLPRRAIVECKSWFYNTESVWNLDSPNRCLSLNSSAAECILTIKDIFLPVWFYGHQYLVGCTHHFNGERSFGLGWRVFNVHIGLQNLPANFSIACVRNLKLEFFSCLWLENYLSQ